VYLAIAPDDAIRTVISKGRAGTAMSAFAQKEGGMLTDAQVDAIVQGIRQRWSSSTSLVGSSLPPYAANTTGDSQRGQAVYSKFCAGCHGDGAAGGSKAGSVLNPAYLSLITDQGLRTIVITGRPDFNAPDFRNNIPGQPMTDQEITDVVAYLAAHRPAVAKMQTMTQPAAGTSGGSQ
jgi:mono/diheme cytochrome c family protein